MSKPKIAIVVGSIRENRFASRPAEWLAAIAQQRRDIEVEIVDLADYPMPLFAEPTSPAYGQSKNEAAQKWQAKLTEFDGYIFTTAEYNHGPTAVLKNALDYAGPQWKRKPAGFVGYGSVGGARAVEQLRAIAVELQMAPVKSAVHILWPDYLAAVQGSKQLSDLDHLNLSATALLDDIAWWASALKSARQTDTLQAKAA